MAVGLHALEKDTCYATAARRTCRTPRGRRSVWGRAALRHGREPPSARPDRTRAPVSAKHKPAVSQASARTVRVRSSRRSLTLLLQGISICPKVIWPQDPLARVAQRVSPRKLSAKNNALKRQVDAEAAAQEACQYGKVGPAGQSDDGQALRIGHKCCCQASCILCLPKGLRAHDQDGSHCVTGHTRG